MSNKLVIVNKGNSHSLYLEHKKLLRHPQTLSCLVSSSVMFSDVEQCEPGWDKFNSFCYRHFGQRQSWEVAEQHCRMLGAHLVSIMTPEEQSYINSRFRPSCFMVYEEFMYIIVYWWLNVMPYCPHQVTTKNTSGLVWMIRPLRMISAGLMGTRWWEILETMSLGGLSSIEVPGDFHMRETSLEKAEYANNYIIENKMSTLKGHSTDFSRSVYHEDYLSACENVWFQRSFVKSKNNLDIISFIKTLQSCIMYYIWSPSLLSSPITFKE